MSGEINWREPIEAVTAQGTAVVAHVIGAHANGWLVFIAGWTCAVVAFLDGTIINSQWRIRNVAQAPETGPTAPSGGEVGSEVVERALELVRDLVSADRFYIDALAKRAAEIVALLPEPVDADLVEARKLAASLIEHHSPVMAAQIAAGHGDDYAPLKHVLAGLKAGRSLEKGEGR